MRKRKYFLGKKKKTYFLFDTLIIEKKLRGRNFSTKIMNFNNKIITKNNKISILFCNNNLINFYKKYNWKRLYKNKFILEDKELKKKNCLTYNNKYYKKKLRICINN